MIYKFYHITDVHYYSKKNYKYDYRKVNCAESVELSCGKQGEL